MRKDDEGTFRFGLKWVDASFNQSEMRNFKIRIIVTFLIFVFVDLVTATSRSCYLVVHCQSKCTYSTQPSRLTSWLQAHNSYRSSSYLFFTALGSVCTIYSSNEEHLSNEGIFFTSTEHHMKWLNRLHNKAQYQMLCVCCVQGLVRIYDFMIFSLQMKTRYSVNMYKLSHRLG